MAHCEFCGTFVKDENLAKHYAKVHPTMARPELPEIQKPKRQKPMRQPMSRKSIATVVGLLLLVVAIGAGIYSIPAPIREEGCIISPAYHWHTTLLVYEDDVLVTIPADVGTDGCLKTMHTHRADNVVHVEPNNADVRHTVRDFFELWGRPFGSPLEITVDGEPVNLSPGTEVLLIDGITIEVRY